MTTPIPPNPERNGVKPTPQGLSRATTILKVIQLTLVAILLLVVWQARDIAFWQKALATILAVILLRTHVFALIRQLKR